jgi:UDP-glucose 4-epimerase
VRTLIVGGYGFIGKHLANAIPGDRWVKLVDKLLDGEDIRSYCLEEDREDVEFDRYDVVYHLAAASDVNAHSLTQLHDTFESTYWALQVAERAGAEHFIFTSSGAIHGDGVAPISVYGACKQGAEGLVHAWAHRTGKKASILRLNNVVGRGCHGVIPDLLRKLRANPARLDVLGDGTAEKCFTHVSEVVRILLDPPTGTWDVRAHDSVLVHDVVRAIVGEVGQPTTVHYGSSPQGWPGDATRQYGVSHERFGLMSSRAAMLRAVAECKREVFG